jgi:GT2 family glycosyltransferase
MTAAQLPFVSIVIPARNAERTLRGCLASVLATDYPAERREVVVVDNASTDGSAAIIEALPVRSVTEERRGVGHARNRGIEASVGDVLAFTDADCFVATSWLRELVAALGPDVAAVAGDIVAYPPATPAERYTALRRPSYIRWSSPGSLPWFQFMNAAVRREAFDRIGLFDTRFRGGCEDVDFCWRIVHAGLVIHRHPRAIVFHRHRTTAKRLFLQHRGYGRGQAALTRKYPQELEWSVVREACAWRDLAAAGVVAASSALGVGRRAGVSPDVDYPALDFVRKLAQRVGFLEGLLRERIRR